MEQLSCRIVFLVLLSEEKKYNPKRNETIVFVSISRGSTQSLELARHGRLFDVARCHVGLVLCVGNMTFSLSFYR